MGTTTVLVTGANSGVGLGTVKLLAQQPNSIIFLTAKVLQDAVEAVNLLDAHSTSTLIPLRNQHFE